MPVAGRNVSIIKRRAESGTCRRKEEKREEGIFVFRRDAIRIFRAAGTGGGNSCRCCGGGAYLWLCLPSPPTVLRAAGCSMNYDNTYLAYEGEQRRKGGKKTVAPQAEEQICNAAACRSLPACRARALFCSRWTLRWHFAQRALPPAGGPTTQKNREGRRVASAARLACLPSWDRSGGSWPVLDRTLGRKEART